MPIRIAVTGRHGQVVRSLLDTGPTLGVELIDIGRPELDLAAPKTVQPALAAIKPDIVVNAAAYTAVDRAEQEPVEANAINGTGAGMVASAAGTLGVPVIHLSTDYVFDGSKPTPYVEEDPVAPCNAYGASKLAGEQAVAAATPNHVILRTGWVYSPYGKNFVRTMLDLAESRDEIQVVADQLGCPTYAPDIAVAIIAITQKLLSNPDNQKLHGLFHLAGKEETTWADFAAAIFEFVAANGMRKPVLIRIASVDYPTTARRPKNSRLDCSKLARLYGVQLPSWRASLRACLERLTGQRQ